MYLYLFLSTYFMKFNYSFFLLCLWMASYSSVAKAQNITDNNTKRLIELDSLSDIQIKDDSLLKETIALAEQLKKYDIAVKQTTNLIRFFNYETNTKEKGKVLISKTKTLLPLVKNKDIVSKFYFEAADLHYYLGEFEESVKNYDSAFFYAKSNVSLKGMSRLGKGIVFVDSGEFGKASIALQEAITYFQENKDTLNWMNAKNSMTILYGKNGFYEDETRERNELIDLALKYKNYPSLPIIYYNSAASSNKMANQKLRINYLKKALRVNEDSEYKEFFSPIIKAALVSAYADNDSLVKANELLRAIEKDSNAISGYNESFYLNAKMRLAFMGNKYTEAENYAKRYLLLKKQSQEFEEIQMVEKFLSRIYKKTKNYEESLKHFENYTVLKDSILGIQKSRILSYYQTLYETEKRDLKIQAQQGNIDLLEAKNKLKTQWLIFGSLGLFFLFVFLNVLRSKKFAKKSQKQQELFSQHILASQEQERNKVAMELHDGVGQQLMLLTRRAKNSEDNTLQELATETLANLRAVSHNLYPVVLKRLGFSQAAQELVNNFDENSDVFFTTEITKIDNRITEEQSLHLYRILQEALQNIIKHAKAKSVTIEIINYKSKIELIIKDNGLGFNYKEILDVANSLGIKSIQERCKMIKANLNINSKPSIGTTIKVTLQV
ncbi:MAG: hypothetical protein CMC55_03830 [Flavobacteriaceae bacterium]|nr:hypothetical protein [Flavobacteriaceae bacterium]